MESKCHGQPFSHDVMGHYYYGIITHTCTVTSNNISLCALLLSEALLHLMYALVYVQLNLGTRFSKCFLTYFVNVAA